MKYTSTLVLMALSILFIGAGCSTATSSPEPTIAPVEEPQATEEPKEEPANPVEKEIDLTTSELLWTGKAVAKEHAGTISLSEGKLTVDGEKILDGMFTIDMTSIAVTDLKGAQADSLKGHLENEDFFNVEKYETATFDITDVEEGSDEGSVITGELTIKDITHTIQFPALVIEQDGVLNITGSFNIDRTKWDVKFGSLAFFSDLGDKAINDEIEFDVELVTKQ